MALAVEVSQIVDDLRGVTFTLDPCEEEAGKAVRELLHKGDSSSDKDSMESSEIKALQLAAPRLHITSPKAIVIEKRSLKKLLDKVGDTDPKRKKILTYLLYLLKKYGNLIIEEYREKASACRHHQSFAFQNLGNGSMYNQSTEVEPQMRYWQNKAQINMLSKAVPPEEFKCPISCRLMYDPVVIASGQTYERMWIQKWIDEGHDTCPKTNMKLTNLSLTPNSAMKELMSSWCTKYGVTISDPSVQPEALHLWETSSTSIASFGSSMNDLRLPIDVSSISLGSIDTGYNSDSSHAKTVDGLSLVQSDSDRCQSDANMCKLDLESLSKLGELSWESQCKVVEDVKNKLKYNDQACHSLSLENFVEPLIMFLKDAHDLEDVKPQRDGFQLLSTFVSKTRNQIPHLPEDAFDLLASFLDSEVSEEVLAILEILSSHRYCRHKITASGALTSILKFLNSGSIDFQEQALKILYNLSSNNDGHSNIVPPECIPTLVSFFKHSDLAGYSLFIMKNLCDTEEARVCITETKGCIASIAEVLETENCQDQELAVAILLSLCSQRVEYCQLVMDEGVIPALVNISVNGNDKGQVGALELLRLLRDTRNGDEQEFTEKPDYAIKESRNQSNERKSSKAYKFFERLTKSSNKKK
ncbi:U-box domain-containing protein 5 isoform X2 [Ziziphus jujuba]|nr:U-box domain-containing protein 5 isoform X2 [Ziziphus jujuba]XP_060674947.1 U-box domain-containing protein 5 isoform X2 [Ziziphus jujuba]